jgi:hypothetical protein
MGAINTASPVHHFARERDDWPSDRELIRATIKKAGVIYSAFFL